MRILLALLALPFLAPLAAAEMDDPAIRHAVEEYLDERPLLAPAEGGILGIFKAQVHVWYPTLDGEISSGGEILDLDGDLGLDDNEFTVMPQIQVTFLGIGLRFDSFFLKYEASNRINRTFTFAGLTFPVSEQVTSEITIDHLRLMLMVPVIKADSVSISLQVGASAMLLDGRLTGSVTGSASETEDIFVPLVGVLVHVKAGKFLIEVDVVGLTLDYSDVSGTVFDVRASVGFTVFEVVALHVGYRHVTIEGSSADFNFDATISGFFVGASVQF